MPPIVTAGKLTVKNLNFPNGYRQYYETNRTDCKTYVRYCSYDNWSNWTEIATTLINSPVNNGAFKLIVEKINMEERIRQTIYANNQNCDTYVRYYNGTWGSWHKINMTTV